MSIKIIGLEITKRTEDKVEGYLKKIQIFRNWKNELEQRNIYVNFILNIKDNTYNIPIGHIEDGIEIGKRLERKGYEDLTLIFNDKKIKISEVKK